MTTAVLFLSCCGVSSETAGSIFCSPWSDVGSFFSCCGLPVCAAMTALWIGLDGWLLGWLIFDEPPAISFRAAMFFVPEFTSLLTPNFMPATACFSLLLYSTVLSVLMIILAGISHTPGKTARLSLNLASSTAS